MFILRDRILSSLETTLSTSNLRAMRCPEAPSKHGLLRILEFATGLPADTPLHNRVAFTCYNRLAYVAQQMALARGRRALFLSLPPDWATAGLFEVRGMSATEPGAVEVAHRFSNSVATIPASKVPAHQTEQDLVINCNWSEERACLVGKVGANAAGVLLAPFFPRQDEVLADGLVKTERKHQSPAKLLKGVSRSALLATPPCKAPPKEEMKDEGMAKEEPQHHSAQTPQKPAPVGGSAASVEDSKASRAQGVSFDESMMAPLVP